jgi:hypothetical protein
MFQERGWRYYKFVGSFGSPQMILQLNLDFADGTTATIVSDEAWRVASGPITFSSIFGGEDYDARLERPGWDRPGFDDTGWQSVTVVDSPGGRLVAQSAPPIKVIETFSPRAVTEPIPGVFVYDLGQNISGRPEISLRGPAGATVRIIASEVLDEKGLADSRGWGCGSGERRHLSYYTYILKGEGVETWHPQFSYYGFRYLQIEGATSGGGPTVMKIEGQFTRNSASRAGSFACSNDLFNRIYHMIDWAIGSNLQSLVTDCPHREKLPWVEIGNLMAPSIMYTYDVPSLYAKIIHDIVESQRPDGMIPTIAPEYVLFSAGFRDSPCDAAANLPWLLYRWYGDRRILAECFSAMKRYVDYLTSRAHDHIVAYGLGDWGDFPSVEEHVGWAQLTPISLTGTAIYYHNAALLARIAAILENADDARHYAALAEEIRKAFNRTFLNPRTNQYACGTPVVPHEVRNEFNQGLFDSSTNEYVGGSQGSHAMPLALGMVEPDRVEAVLTNLVTEVKKRKYTTVGDMGHPFLLRALADHGRSDVIYALHNQTTAPGYGWQIERGNTTLTETRDGRPCASMNHCTFGSIQEWFHANVLGIQCDPDAVAFSRIVIRPQIVGDLKWARGHYDSIRGEIHVDWRIDHGELNLQVTIPANTSATVYFPTTCLDNIFESGKPANQAPGVTSLGTGEGSVIFGIESGSYFFTLPWKETLI